METGKQSPEGPRGKARQRRGGGCPSQRTVQERGSEPPQERLGGRDPCGSPVIPQSPQQLPHPQAGSLVVLSPSLPCSSNFWLPWARWGAGRLPQSPPGCTWGRPGCRTGGHFPHSPQSWALPCLSALGSPFTRALHFCAPVPQSACRPVSPTLLWKVCSRHSKMRQASSQHSGPRVLSAVPQSSPQAGQS